MNSLVKDTSTTFVGNKIDRSGLKSKVIPSVLVRQKQDRGCAIY